VAVDETAFRQVRKDAVEHPCPFEKALLSGCGTCMRAQRLHIAEREAVACREDAAREACAALLAVLRRNAAFALHLAHADGELTHAQHMKIQCGGLAGLQRALTGTEAVGDIGELVCAVGRAENGPQALPWSAIMQSVAAWQLRRRARQS
jgi:hypothetical protein